MAFRDPLYRYSSIDETNFLKPKIENFLEKESPTAFHSAISTLVRTRDVLRVAESIGRLGEIANTTYFEQAIQWLNGQSSINHWANIQQIASYDDITDDIANNFNSYVSNACSNITNQPLFQQIQIMQGVIDNDIISNVREKIKEPLEDEFNRILVDSRTAVIEKLDESHTQKEANLNTLFQGQVEEIRKTGQDAVATFEGARALANWSTFYAQRVEVYKNAVYGKTWPQDALTNKIKSFKNYRKSLPIKERIWTVLQVRHGLWRCIRKSLSIFVSKLNSYSGKRFLWFMALTAGVLLFIYVNLLSIYGTNQTFLGFELNKLKPQHQDTQLFAKIAVYLAVLLIPTLGYSFANKNYRIYSNLLEQYRHREVVAETIQGILAKPRGDDADEAVRKELANVASTALFEQKTVGHLSKNEGNSVSLLDIARIFRS